MLGLIAPNCELVGSKCFPVIPQPKWNGEHGFYYSRGLERGSFWHFFLLFLFPMASSDKCRSNQRRLSERRDIWRTHSSLSHLSALSAHKPGEVLLLMLLMYTFKTVTPPLPSYWNLLLRVRLVGLIAGRCVQWFTWCPSDRVLTEWRCKDICSLRDTECHLLFPRGELFFIMLHLKTGIKCGQIGRASCRERV